MVQPRVAALSRQEGRSLSVSPRGSTAQYSTAPRHQLRAPVSSAPHLQGTGWSDGFQSLLTGLSSTGLLSTRLLSTHLCEGVGWRSLDPPPVYNHQSLTPGTSSIHAGDLGMFMPSFPIAQRSLIFITPGTGFVEDSLYMDGVGSGGSGGNASNACLLNRFSCV